MFGSMRRVVTRDLPRPYHHPKNDPLAAALLENNQVLNASKTIENLDTRTMPRPSGRPLCFVLATQKTLACKVRYA